MDMKTAYINWKNFFRGMVGLEKTFPVKVMRVGDANKFAVIHASKKGDVGYNLTSIDRLTISAMSDENRKEYAELAHEHALLKSKHSNSKVFGKVAEAKHIAVDMEELEARMENLIPKAVIPTGIRIQMPNNLWCSIEARSSSSSKMLITPDAIIDSGYTGEMFVVVYNFGYMDHEVNFGDQLAQLIFHERISIQPLETTKFSATERGETGFGSTGVKAKRVN